MNPLVTISHKLASRRVRMALLAAVVVPLATMVAAGCGSDEEAPTGVVLVTHDSVRRLEGRDQGLRGREWLDADDPPGRRRG